MSRSAVHPTLDVAFRHEADCMFVDLVGDLDRDSAWALTAAVIRAESSPATRLVLDFHALTFIDAGGLRAVADAARRARRHGREIEIANPSVHLARLLRLTGLDQSLTVLPGEGDAPRRSRMKPWAALEEAQGPAARG